MKQTSLFFLLCFVLILGIGILFRFTGLNWDQGHYLHPDERFLMMVATSMKWPTSLSEYFQTDESPLNPHNIGYNFYVYGTWPVIFIRIISEMVGKNAYGNIHVVGRVLSASLDIVTLITIFFITKRLYSSRTTHVKTSISPVIPALLAMFIYSIMLLPIQLSHFSTVDPYVITSITLLLLMLTFYPTWKSGALGGTFFALALSAKISAIPIIIPLMLYFFVYVFSAYKTKKYTHLLYFFLFFSLTSICVFRIFTPYLFADNSLFLINPKVINNWKELQGFNDPDAWFPPGIQWINTPSLIYPTIQLFYWGLGVPLTWLSIVSFFWLSKKLSGPLYSDIITLFRKSNSTNEQKTTHIQQISTLLISLPIIIIAIFFLYQSMQYVMPLRYFWPIFPSLAIIIGIGLIDIYVQFEQKIVLSVIGVFLVFSLTAPLAYMSIYTSPHSRVAASEWIYTNIPTNTVISSEHWDDGLPLNIENFGLNSFYQTIELPLYDPDSLEKWKDIAIKLDAIEYIIVTSNRVYGSITSAPERYPITTKYYQHLFSGSLGFSKVAEFTSRPTITFPFLSACISPPFLYYGSVDTLSSKQTCEDGIVFIDDYAEESWTVYDHPKITIFKKNSSYQTPQLY